MNILILISLAMAALITINACQESNMVQQGVAGEMTKERENMKKCSTLSGNISIRATGADNLWTAAPSIAVPFSITMTSKNDRLRNRKRPWENPESSINRSLRRFFNSQDFTRQKSITKIIIRTILSGIVSTGTVLAEITS